MTDRYAESDTWPNPTTPTEPARPATESHAGGSRVVGEVSDAQKAREARYAEAIRKNLAIPAEVGRWANVLAEVVVAVRDDELEQARAENERLTEAEAALRYRNLILEARWRTFRGQKRTAESALTEARAEAERMRGEVQQWHDTAYRWAYFNQTRATSAESVLTEAREQLSRLREAVEGLADEWEVKGGDGR